ncbi:hypothetical protein NIES4071_110100 (plasmid) [Calothrix sp. NIES-4071]|nr:hypothetical protein NIES4071_110100 [Calothrix sp. NIES-4071]
MPQDSLIQKGGRGKKAPYESTHSRVPAPLKAQITELINTYQEFVEQGGDPENPPQFYSKQDTKINPAIDKITKKLKQLEVHVTAKDKGYSANSFSQGIKLLKEIFDLTKPVNG